jgi:hypothetical protein
VSKTRIWVKSLSVLKLCSASGQLLVKFTPK